MSKQTRDTRLRISFANRWVAVCVAILLAVSPAGMIAFAADGAPNSNVAAGVSEVPVEVGIPDGSASEVPDDAHDSAAALDAQEQTSREDVVRDPAEAVAGIGAASDSPQPLADIVGNLETDIKWINVPDSQKLDLSWSDPTNLSNPTQTVTYRLSISSSNTGYDAGKLVIRVPRSLWKDRSGTDINPTALGIPIAPAVGSSNIPFNYSVDTATNELVITNTEATQAAANYEIDVQYSVIPWNTVDGSRAQFKANVEGTTVGGLVNRIESNIITYTIDTDVRTDNVLKTDGKPMYYWDSAFTGGKPKPVDFANYRWTTWRVVMGGAANQPYTVTLNDIPGNGGEVYAVSDGDLYYRDLKGSDFTLNADGSITSKVFNDLTVRGPASAPIPSNGEGNCIRVLVRYPKTGGTVLTNSITSTLMGVDDRIPHVTSSIASMEWKDFVFPQGDYPLSMVKFSDIYEQQNKTIDSMLSVLQRGEDVSLTWGMRTTGNVYEGINYVRESYHGEMVDDHTYWALMTESGASTQANTLMTKDDFSYKSAKVYVTTYLVDRNTGEKTYFNQSDPNAPKITVWGMTDEAAGFQEVGSFAASELSYDGASGELYKSFNFPDGTFRAKVTFGDTKDYLYLRMDPTVEIKASSPTLRSWFDSAAAAGVTGSALRVQNFNYYQVYSEKNEPLNLNGAERYAFDSPYVDNALLTANDKAEYGKMLDRSTAGITLTSLAGSSKSLKYAANPINDTGEQAVHIDYWLHGRDWYKLTTADYAALIDSGWPAPARNEARFYDLLPRGMVYDGRQPPVVYDINGLSYTSTVSTHTIDNFRGTGRQMVEFSIAAKSAGTNITASTELWEPQVNGDGSVSMVLVGYQSPSQAGYTVKFRATLPWNKVLLANNDYNLSAFQVPSNEPLRGDGHADDGLAPIVQDVKGEDGLPVFNDLRGDGVDAHILDTKYQTLPVKINVPIALGSGLTKHVRSDADIKPFTKEAITQLDGGYTYRLTVDTDSITRMKDLVVFDILEEAKNIGGATGESSWKGVLDSIDVSDARLLGIEPHVYYSTATNLSYESLDVNDLGNPALWSTQEPADHATITAVAVDMRLAVNGSEYVFDPSTGVAVLLHMKAPGTLPTPQYAFNRAAYHSTLLDPSGSEKTETNVGDRTMVSIIDAPVLSKSSDPLGGTNAESATSVSAGQEITYTLWFDPWRVNAQNIVVKDAVPTGLDFVPGSITFVPAGTTDIQAVADEAYDSQTGTITWPAYNQGASGFAKFQFRVTVRALENATSYLLYENKATATMGVDPPIESNVVTHQQQNRWTDVAKTAAQVAGVATTDPDAAHGGTVLDEKSGSEDAPVPTDLEQIIEYHLLVKNSGDKQTSGELNVSDSIPIGATYIPGSATFTFRSSANPEGPVADSLATGTLQEPTAGNAYIIWKLNQMTDGEEAFLTFRVAAPSTAFIPEQPGMWAERVFTNSAQLVDVAKNETKSTGTTYHKVQEARMTVTKQWDDADNKDGYRPESIEVQLSADGTAVGDPVILSADNDWAYSWTKLAATKGETSEHVQYAVTETKTVAGYEKPAYSVDPEDESLAIIVNKRNVDTPVVPEPPVTPPTQPSTQPPATTSLAGARSFAATGDSIPLAVVGILVAAGALVAGVAGAYVLRKSRKRNE